MATRSDQLHSHQFALHRVVAAVVLRDPEAPTSPLRRVSAALFAGVMLAALGLAAAGVYGLLRPSSGDAWRDGGSVIIERETGARFVYRNGLLHPVANYSSALLILGTANPPSTTVPRDALVGVPRGAPLGIPGAPDLLPAPDQLLGDPWTVCSRAPAGDSGSAESTRVESLLLVGTALDGQETGGGSDDVLAFGARGLLARDEMGGLHLLVGGRRHVIRTPNLVLPALTWSPDQAVPVATAVLNAVPPGGDLDRIPNERKDEPGPVPGLRVGQVIVVVSSAGEKRFGLVRPEGIADITQVQADLLIADGANGLNGGPIEIGQALYASAPRAESLVPTSPSAPPATTPELVRPARRDAVCAVFRDGAATPELVLATAALPEGGATPAGAATNEGVTADRVVVPPGRGVVVTALPGPDAPGGAVSFVSDLGQRYPLADPQVMTALGYGEVAPVRLPAAVVSLLPAGPALDPAAAAAPNEP